MDFLDVIGRVKYWYIEKRAGMSMKAMRTTVSRRF